MNKYINAKELLNEVWTESVEGRIFDDNTYVGTFNVVPIGDITEIVNQMPSADVVEVKHGKWVSSYKTWEFTFECSVCGKENYEESNFCPHCGADMRGEAK